ncbi:cadmium/zinc-transporting ATPase HMA3 isoform X2 [Magnolia sinica]|uniref:cadmium/zinc-transporting ATPase HMA3 isoform X2 n=1 Tax=Magnolia sinica TaxID=86752 RepID=UPI00265A8D99|nr:cadmium/zinc-transporting ATPase HMA3 isoform X2 [Magnolia sinica]
MASTDKSKAVKFQKSYFDVLGICCSSEVPLIEKILQPLEGIEKVSVIVPTRTVIVVHDNLLISQIQIVKALNQARLEANIRVYGQERNGKNWPSPYTVACGILLVISFFKFFFRPLLWFAVGATAVGLPPILLRSVAALRRFTLDINILVLIAVGGTIALGDYWEAGSIVFLFTIAEWLESRASHKATAVMSSLMSMAPQKAILAENGQVVDAKDVKVNTILAVKAGDVIPIDGIVVKGKSEVDERTLTGESLPVAKQVQSSVWAGTINLNGYISVKTTALAEDSAVARMAKLVEEAQHNKSKTQRLIDTCAKYYTPGVVLISLAFAVVPAALRVHDLRHWFRLGLVLLVSACPCALILSTPVATFCSLTKAATMGLLIKGGDYLESLAKIKIVAFDKTGTITRGEFTITEFRSVCDDISMDTLLYWISSIESKSGHPMAAALVDYSRLNGVEPQPEDVKEFQILPGEGIYGEIDGKSIYVGNKRIAIRAGCEQVPSLEEAKEGSTVGYVFLGSMAVGIFSLSDTCRSGVAEAIDELKSMGITTAMLTGDSRAAALHVQEQLNHAIGAVHAELLPEEKVKIIKELKNDGPTAMVGDGMNDAPALATADIGISMGISGSTVATETGHITLMSNDIRKIPQSILLARITRRKIIENVGLSIFTKIAILVLAFMGHPLLWAAVLADVGTCLLVIFNSMLLLRGTTVPKQRSSKSSHTSDGQKSHGCCSGGHTKGACGPDDHHHSTHVSRQCCSNGGGPNTSDGGKGRSCLQVGSGPCEKDNVMCSGHVHGGHTSGNGCCGRDLTPHAADIHTCVDGVNGHDHRSCDDAHAACEQHNHLDGPSTPPCGHDCSKDGTHVNSARHEHAISIVGGEGISQVGSGPCEKDNKHVHGGHTSGDGCEHEKHVHGGHTSGIGRGHAKHGCEGDSTSHAAHVHTCENGVNGHDHAHATCAQHNHLDGPSTPPCGPDHCHDCSKDGTHVRHEISIVGEKGRAAPQVGSGSCEKDNVMCSGHVHGGHTSSVGCGHEKHVCDGDSTPHAAHVHACENEVNGHDHGSSDHAHPTCAQHNHLDCSRTLVDERGGHTPQSCCSHVHASGTGAVCTAHVYAI